MHTRYIILLLFLISACEASERIEGQWAENARNKMEFFEDGSFVIITGKKQHHGTYVMLDENRIRMTYTGIIGALSGPKTYLYHFEGPTLTLKERGTNKTIKLRRQHEDIHTRRLSLTTTEAEFNRIKVETDRLINNWLNRGRAELRQFGRVETRLYEPDYIAQLLNEEVAPGTFSTNPNARGIHVASEGTVGTIGYTILVSIPNPDGSHKHISYQW